MPTPPAAPGAQYTLQFLSTALSQRGPAALPYAEDAKWLIRQHLVALAEEFPSLHPKSSTYTHNDGRSVYLLQAEGTLPVPYRGAVYNFPTVVWLLETYPRRPPAVFLCPTRDMLVKPGHPFVEPSGLVHDVPYLAGWVYPTSNLVDLFRSLSQLFGLDPPLYSRNPSANADANPRPNPSPTPSSSPPPSHHHNHQVSPPASSLSPASTSLSTSSSRIYPNFAPYGGRFPQSPQTHPAPVSRLTEDPADVYRRNAMAKILDTVHGEMTGLRRAREAEIEGLFSTQAELRRREEKLTHGVQQMVDEKEGLEHQLQLVLMNTDLLEGWLRENKGKKRRADTVDVDDAFQPVDARSRQMLDCTAADLTVEDVIYSLDKALQEGTVPFEYYLKSIRALSREQFFHRATVTKVRAAQVHAQVTSMAARVPHHAC